MLAEIATTLSRPHPDAHGILEQYLGPGDPEPGGPLLHDLLAGGGGLDTMLDAYLHYADGPPPSEISLRRLCSYWGNLGEFLEQDAKVYGWPRES